MRPAGRPRSQIALVLTLASSSALACDPPALSGAAEFVESASYRVAFRSNPKPIAVAEPFALEMSVCAKPGSVPPEGMAIDATMPEHRHGMNYRPTVIDGPDGRFLVEGMLFHMPGRWQLIFEVRTAAGSQRLTRDLVVE